MWAVPVSGFFLSNSYKSNNVKFLGLTLPDIFPQNSAILGLARNMHFWLAYIFLAFVVLHMIDQWKVVKALWRRFNQTMTRLKQSFAK
jgi:cytochrome b561